MPDLYGLTAQQFNDVGRLVTKDKTLQQSVPFGGLQTGRSEMIRILTPAEPQYRNIPFLCAVFDYVGPGKLYTVYLTGHDMAGNIIISINGEDVALVPANSAEWQLRILFADFKLLTVTAWAGTWEFDARNYSQREPFVLTARAEPIIEDDETFEPFEGEILVVQESWAAAKVLGTRATNHFGETRDVVEAVYVEVVDALPYSPVTITAGAIGLASWHPQAGWIVTAWQCRAISFLRPIEPEPEEDLGFNPDSEIN